MPTPNREPRRLTADEYASMAGVERITWAEFQRRALALGYRIETSDPCHGSARIMSTYGETLLVPGDTYPETSYRATHIASGLGFAHVDAPRDTLPAFQALRRDTVCVSRGRIRSV